MNKLSKIFVITASLLAVGYTLFDFFFASKGDQDLIKFEEVYVEPEINTSVYNFLAKDASKIYVPEDEISK